MEEKESLHNKALRENTENSSNQGVGSDYVETFTEKYEKQKKAFTDIWEKQEKSKQNTEGSIAQNVTTTVTNIVDGGVATFSAVTGLTSQISETMVLPILKKINIFKGQANLPVCKQLDPVMNLLDLHMVTIPPSPAPVPMIHPFVGVSFRAKDFVALAAMSANILFDEGLDNLVDYAENNDIISQENAELAKGVMVTRNTVAQIVISLIGATVKVGPILPRTIAGTSTKNIMHIPMGAGFHPAASAMIKKNHGHAWLGSMFVVADGYPLVGSLVHFQNVCSDIGAPSIHDMNGNPNVSGGVQAKLYMPTGIIASIPLGRPVLTNPIPAPINPLLGPKMLMRTGFTKLKQKQVKKVQDNIAKGKGCSNVSRGLNSINKKLFDNKITRGVYNKVDKLVKTYLGHPVDVAGGDLFTDSTDFSFAGVLPFSFDRVWYSDSDYIGPLGHGWHHSYDMALFVNTEYRRAQVRLEDGRLINFDRIPTKEYPTARYHRSEKLWLCYHSDGYYYVRNQQEQLYLFTAKSYQNKQEAHLLSSISNREGFAIRFSYDSKGHLQEIKDSVSRIYRVENDAEGRIRKIWTAGSDEGSPEVCLSEYLYNAQGNMVVHYDEMRQSMQMEYANHLLVQETWRNGHRWYFKYDGNQTGAKCIETWGDGRIQHFKLTYYKGETHALDGEGNKTIYKHRNGIVYETTDANGAVWQKFYNKYDELERSTDPLGNARSLIRDDHGNVSKVILPDGQFTQITYTESAYPYLPTEVKDARGGKWIYKYNDAGKLREMINPLGAKTNFKYNSDGLPSSILSGLGVEMQMKYDGSYNLSQLISTTGQRTDYDYDKWNRCTSVTNAKGIIQKRILDKLGRPVVINDFDNNIIQLQYDQIDNITQYKDENRVIHFRYKGIHKLLARSEAGKTVRYQYDSNERLRSITNEQGEMYFFGLDGVGNVVAEKGYDGIKKSYQRNASGWVEAVYRPSDRWTKYSHDEMGRVIEVNYSDQSKESYAYEAGLLSQATNEAGTLSVQYDILGNVIQECFNGEKVESQYDAYGRRTNLSSSLGADFTHSFDQWSNVVESQLNNWKMTMEYDPFGLESIREYIGGIKQEWEYDKIGRLKTQRIQKQKNSAYVTPDFYRQYTWSQGGLLSQITDQGHKHTYFEHDKRGFLQSVIYQGKEKEERGVDASGNLYNQLDCKDRKYEFSRLEESKTAKYNYDKEGNLIQKTEKATGKKWKYHWNGAGMLTRVERPDGYSVHFLYDALGRRVSKQYKSVTTHYVWDGNVVLHEHKSFDAREATADDIITWVFEQDSYAPMAKIKGDKKYSIVTDHLGTPIRGYTEEGDKIWERELDSFGNVRMDVGDEGFCNYLYQGQTLDKETGLAYNRFRYYDPEQGNYISQDPIGLAGGNPTLYGYVGDPTEWLDVFGFSPSSTLNTALGGVLNDGMAAHHLIPISVYDEYNSLFTAVGIRRDDRSNGLLMPSSEAKAIALGDKDMITHVGGHPDYIDSVKSEVDRIDKAFGNGNMSKRQAKKELRKIQKKYKSRIINKKVTTKITPCGGSNTMS